MKKLLKKNWIVCLIALIGLLLCSTAQAASVTLAWDANDVAPDGYRMFQRVDGASYDYTSPVWQGTATTCTIDNLANSTTYYFVVRAYVGIDESGDSNEVQHQTSIQAPRNLRFVAEIAVMVDDAGNVYVAKK